MRLRLLFLMLLCGSGATCPALEPTARVAVPTNEITLGQAVAWAEKAHPELLAAGYGVEAAAGRAVQATARLNPAVGVEVENVGGRGQQQAWDAAETTLQLEQTFELGGKRDKRVRVANAEQQLSGQDRELCRLTVRAETARRFFSVLGAQAQRALAREDLALAEEFVKIVTVRVDAGKVSSMELEKARILLAQKRITRDQAQQELATACQLLALQWGGPPSFETVAGDLADVYAGGRCFAPVADLR